MPKSAGCRSLCFLTPEVRRHEVNRRGDFVADGHRSPTSIVEGVHPILLGARDLEDGGWKVLGGGEVDMVVRLQERLEHDPTNPEVSDLEPGWQAERDRMSPAGAANN